MKNPFVIPKKDDGPATRIHVSLTTATHAKLEQLCQQTGRGPSDIISHLINVAETEAPDA